MTGLLGSEMNYTFDSDYAWQHPFLPAVKILLAPFVIQQTSEKVDREEAADLIVAGGTVAVRLRRNGASGSPTDYAGKYPFEFTIRRSRSNRMSTEANKIMEGYGDWMFYGHVREGGHHSLDGVVTECLPEFFRVDSLVQRDR